MRVLYLVFIVAILALFSACREPGPAEQAGRNIDEAASDAADSVEDVCENVSDALAAELDC